MTSSKGGALGEQERRRGVTQVVEALPIAADTESWAPVRARRVATLAADHPSYLHFAASDGSVVVWRSLVPASHMSTMRS